MTPINSSINPAEIYTDKLAVLSPFLGVDVIRLILSYDSPFCNASLSCQRYDSESHTIASLTVQRTAKGHPILAAYHRAKMLIDSDFVTLMSMDNAASPPKVIDSPLRVSQDDYSVKLAVGTKQIFVRYTLTKDDCGIFMFDFAKKLTRLALTGKNPGVEQGFFDYDSHSSSLVASSWPKKAEAQTSLFIYKEDGSSLQNYKRWTLASHAVPVKNNKMVIVAGGIALKQGEEETPLDLELERDVIIEKSTTNPQKTHLFLSTRNPPSLIAFNLETLALRWKKEMPYTASAIAANKTHVVYFSNPKSEFTIYDSLTGDPLCRYELPTTSAYTTLFFGDKSLALIGDRPTLYRFAK